MATDMIIRPIDGVISLVTDDREMIAEAILVDQDGRVSVMDNRKALYVGRLVPSMREMAAKCRKAVVILMTGGTVASCTDVEYRNMAMAGRN